MADSTVASISFTADELEEITQWFNDGQTAGNYSEMYSNLAELLQGKLADAAPSDRELIQQDILWLQGATQANAGQGIYSVLIRDYTEAEYTARTGQQVSPTVMQDGSNQVAINLYNQIQQLNGGIPDLSAIATSDASAVGTTIFFPVLPTDSASTSQNAAWSGTVLFSMLGSNQTGRLVSNGSTVQSLDDARNVLLSMFSLEQGLEGVLSQGC